jgi:hypothetical protein
MSLVNRMPRDASPPHVETGARSSMLRNNKVSPWPRKAVRPPVLLLQAPNDATQNIRLGSDVIVGTALQII